MAKRSLVEVVTGFVVLVVTAGFLAYAAAHTGHGAASGVTMVARFDNVGSLAAGSDVRIGGVPVGRVLDTSIDPKTYQAVVRFTVEPGIAVPSDSSATVSTGGLLGAAFLTLNPGAADTMLREGGVVPNTQSAANLEDLLGKFIFNVGSLADATQKSLKQTADPKP